MQLFKKVLLFYKLAEGEPTKEEYNRELQELDGISLDRIGEFIVNWKDTPFFKLNDVINLIILNVGDSASFTSSIYWLEDSIFNAGLTDDIFSKILDAVLLHYLRNKPETFTIGDYYDVEHFKPRLSESTFKLAQNRLMILLLNLIKEFNSEDTKLDRRASIMEKFRGLYEKAKYVPKSLMEGLIKRLGPESYGSIFSNHASHLLESKDKLDEYGIELTFKKTGMFKREEFENMLNKATPEGKDYMRRFLYNGVDSHNYNAKTKWFMLSEDMTPMNWEYKKIELPQFINPIRISDWIEDSAIKNRWIQIMYDFGIVPA